MIPEPVALLLEHADRLQSVAAGHTREADRHVKAAEECRTSARQVAERAAALRVAADELKRNGHG